MAHLIYPATSISLFKERMVFAMKAYRLGEKFPYACTRYDYLTLPLGSDDRLIGETTRKAMNDILTFEGKENQPTPESGMGRLSEFIGAKNDREYEKRTIKISCYLDPKKNKIEFGSLRRTGRAWIGLDSDPSFSIPGDASDEALGAAVRKAFALCDPKKNEYLPLLYPGGNFPKEVLKMHGARGLKVAAPKVDMSVSGPMAFGPRMTWLAVKGANDPLEFMESVGVFKFRSLEWEEALEGIMEVFRGNTAIVTQQIKGWSFVIWPCFGEKGSRRNQAFLMKLSRKYGEAQVFGSTRANDYCLWAKAVDGKLVRWFKYVQGEIESLGEVTKEEKRVLTYGKKPVDDWQPDVEEDPFRMAGAWSLNPMDFAPGVPQAVGPCWTGTAMMG